MNKLFLILIILFVKNCNCNHVEKYSFVNWNNEIKSFENISVNLGEFHFKPNVENCFCKGENITLKGKVQTVQMLQDPKKTLNSNVVIINSDFNNKIIDTLFVTKNDGDFYFSFDKKKVKNIIYKLEDKNFGVKFKISDFK
jgi:hypothetical protein